MDTTTTHKTAPESRGAQLEAAKLRWERAANIHATRSADALVALDAAQSAIRRRDAAQDELQAAEANMQGVICGNPHQPAPAAGVASVQNPKPASDEELFEQPAA